jgi:hypothetical protein
MAVVTLLGSMDKLQTHQVLGLRADLGMVAKIYLGVDGGAKDLTLKCYDKDRPKILALIKHFLTALMQNYT